MARRSPKVHGIQILCASQRGHAIPGLPVSLIPDEIHHPSVSHMYGETYPAYASPYLSVTQRGCAGHESTEIRGINASQGGLEIQIRRASQPFHGIHVLFVSQLNLETHLSNAIQTRSEIHVFFVSHLPSEFQPASTNPTTTP